MSTCHSNVCEDHPLARKIALVGNPNVGKSVLFHHLTGRYALVSNYPGTTVEISSGLARNLPNATILDTPGIISLPPRTEDEDVTAKVLLQDHVQVFIQVGDAKNLRRTLTLAFQLAELGVPMVLALNMVDEAQQRGIGLRQDWLEAQLGIPVVMTVATRNQGTQELVQAIQNARKANRIIHYHPVIEDACNKIMPLIPQTHLSRRGLAIRWLSEDRIVVPWIEERVSMDALQKLLTLKKVAHEKLGEHPSQSISNTLQDTVIFFQQEGSRQETGQSLSISAFLSQLSTHPVWGFLFLGVILAAVYWFVGVFGAGTLVDFFEGRVFAELINPWVQQAISQISPWPVLTEFIVGEYGIWTMAVTYAVALLLPIVVTFFLTFGVLEDSGYLPRLAVLSNSLFERLGLNGKAVLPMILGLGCVTMATLTTRVLESKRDRLLVIFLLALAVPCSAQLGVVMGMLAGISLGASLIWGGVVLGILLTVGWLAARLMPGERSPLLVELPPLRFPLLKNVLLKTVARFEWYIKEAVPLFFLGTVLLFGLDQLKILPWLIKAGEPLVSGWLGLPPQASAAFLLGFLRRDFAATGLFALQNQGLLSPAQVVVSIVTITLFIPCIASLLMVVKERGWKTAVGMAVLIFPMAFVVGGVLMRALVFIRWEG